jgi:segregation and condensation protein B
MNEREITPDDDPIGLDDVEQMLPAEDEGADTPETERVVAEPPADDSPEAEIETPSSLGLSPAEQGALLTALLFAAGEVVANDRLAEYFQVDPAELEILAEETAGALRHLGLDVLAVADGLKLVTSTQWDGHLRAFHSRERRGRLSKSALEILAVIAYEQPVTRVRIDELRQVNSESTLRSLLDKRLITVKGRAETPGRPFLYGTTSRFLEVFGLRGLEDLPPRPASLEAAKGIDLGSRGDATPGLDDLPGFDEELLEQDDLED